MITKCEVCGNKIRTVYKLPHEDIVGMVHGKYIQYIGICDTCGLVITQNPFSEEQLSNRYINFSKFEYDKDDYFLDETSEYMQRSQQQEHFICDSIKDVHSVLEVGAASGYNLGLYQKRGCQCLGIEPSKANCDLAKENYGVDMFNGVFQEYVQQPNPELFDLILLSMTLEHIVHPYLFILSCKNINSKYIFIEVPTIDMKLLDEPMGMFCEEHVNYFTFEGLYNLMKAAGYALVKAEVPVGIGKRLPAAWPALDTLWEKKTHVDNIVPVISSAQIFEAYIKANELLLRQVRTKIRNISPDERLAVWGTGHHVSMLLGNTDLGRKNIVWFYDSDRRKYDWPMWGKPIKAFNITDVCDKKIDAILIGSYIYQEEIYNKLRAYSDTVKIYTLY